MKDIIKQIKDVLARIKGDGEVVLVVSKKADKFEIRSVKSSNSKYLTRVESAPMGEYIEKYTKTHHEAMKRSYGDPDGPNKS